jgi:hypothetical protein
VLSASLNDWNTVSDIGANAVTAAALIAGGVWAYWRFVRERTRWPRADVELVFTQHRLDDEFTLLNVGIRIKNAGRGLMQLTRLRVNLYRIRPLDTEMPKKIRAGDQYEKNGAEAMWPEIKQLERTWPGQKAELEPEENDKFDFDFFVDPSTEAVLAYAFVENVKKRHGRRSLGWFATAFHDMAT